MRDFYGKKLKGIVAFFLLGLYVGGMSGPSGIYLAHDLHHLFTHTLYQHFYHEYAHFRGIHHEHQKNHGHGHTHNIVIDFALQRLEEDKEHHHSEETSMTPPAFKYNDHVRGQHIHLLTYIITKAPFLFINYSCSDLTDQEPDLPPPKLA